MEIVLQCKRFNDDLLLNVADLGAARKAFPLVSPVLSTPGLAEAFAPVDKAANQLKRKGRRLGLTAIALGLLALLLAAAAPVYSQLSSWLANAVAVLSAVSGVAGTVLGVVGMQYGGTKTRWLQLRMVTERFRQFHFQNLALNMQNATRALTDSQRREEFLHQTQRRFQAVDTRFTNSRGPEYGALVSDEGPPHDAWRMLPDDDSDAVSLIVGPAEKELFQAYRELRIVHQINYARHALRKPETLFDFPCRRQAKWLTAIALLCVAGIFLLHMWQVFVVMFHHDDAYDAWHSVVVMWLALVALAAKGVEEGLGSPREVERYSWYLTQCEELRRSFDQANSLARKVAVMRDFEKCSFDEMLDFLRTHERAIFVL